MAGIPRALRTTESRPDRAQPPLHAQLVPDLERSGVAMNTAPPGPSAAREAILRAAFEDTSDVVVACDPHGRVTLFNRASEALATMNTDDLVESLAANVTLSLDATPIEGADRPLLRALRGETVRDVEVVVTGTSGRRRTILVSGRRLFDTDGELLGAIVVGRDITEQREAEAGLAFQALHDPLTRLPNRALFVDRVKLALTRAQRQDWSTAVLAINLDRFADVAGRLGGDAGDQLVAEVSRRLEVTLRPYDVVSRPLDTLARLGGDQFLLLCENIEDDHVAQLVANRIDAALRAPMTIGEETLSMTAGIGITLTRDPHHDPETLIFEAETAMRWAKQRGVGRQVPFVPEMGARRHARAETEAALRMALARNEFRIAYQPKISLMTGRPTGVEALLRWDHPVRGVIAPLDFIPLAEETGLIVPIGAWVLAEVCRDAKRWARALPGARPLMMAINVSPRQFEAGLAETFGAIIAEAEVDARTLCLEVTESMVMEDADQAIETLGALKALGVAISIDDFGTGFSSLAYLKRFPLDELKIDKSFVDGLGKDPEATAIVAAVMGMAHALALRVVAEGVETADQAERLNTLGCDEAQGYYFARPGSRAQIDLLLGGETAPRPARPHHTGDREGMGRPERILVVDDAADVRQLARSSLAAVGYEVEEAASGEEAIMKTRQFRPDCLVLDINLPGISGLDVCRVLRADPENRDVTIVILTADAEAAEKVEAFSVKADDYMTKPFSPRDLVSRVRAAMGRANRTADKAR